MKCSKCDFENRPDARFCKQCGQPMLAQATPPTPPASAGTVCSACGATAKPGARFCLRCGNPLATRPAPSTPTSPASQPPPPTPSYQPSPPPSLPTTPSPQAVAPPLPPSTGQTTDYMPSPQQPPPPAEPSVSKSRVPSWVWWVGGVIALFCLVAIIVVAVKFLGTEEPTATPMQVETPTQVLATETATAPPSATPPPTDTPVPETPTPIPPTGTPMAFNPQINITPSVEQLSIGESLIVTITVINNGQANFNNLYYQLMGPWQSTLTAGEQEILKEIEIAPNTSDTVTFALNAAQEGTARLYVSVRMNIQTDPPYTDQKSSGEITITVIP